MKKFIYVTLMGVALALSSCLSTIHPIFTEKDLVTDARLIGNWKDATDSDGTIQISQATKQDLSELPGLSKIAQKTYMIRYSNKEGIVQQAFFGFLVKLGNNYYMDYYPAETPSTKTYDEFYKSHYIKMHTCFKITFKNNNSFELKQLDDTYMKNLIDNKKIRIRHEIRDDGSFVVTASTEELQQYILKYSDVSEAFYESNTNTYNKIK